MIKEDMVKENWVDITEENALFSTLFLKHDDGNITIVQDLKSNDGINVPPMTVYLDKTMLKEINR